MTSRSDAESPNDETAYLKVRSDYRVSLFQTDQLRLGGYWVTTLTEYDASDVSKGKQSFEVTIPSPPPLRIASGARAIPLCRLRNDIDGDVTLTQMLRRVLSDPVDELLSMHAAAQTARSSGVEGDPSDSGQGVLSQNASAASQDPEELTERLLRPTEQHLETMLAAVLPFLNKAAIHAETERAQLEKQLLEVDTRALMDTFAGSADFELGMRGRMATTIWAKRSLTKIRDDCLALLDVQDLGMRIAGHLADCDPAYFVSGHDLARRWDATNSKASRVTGNLARFAMASSSLERQAASMQMDTTSMHQMNVSQLRELLSDLMMRTKLQAGSSILALESPGTAKTKGEMDRPGEIVKKKAKPRGKRGGKKVKAKAEKRRAQADEAETQAGTTADVAFVKDKSSDVPSEHGVSESLLAHDQQAVDDNAREVDSVRMCESANGVFVTPAENPAAVPAAFEESAGRENPPTADFQISACGNTPQQAAQDEAEQADADDQADTTDEEEDDGELEQGSGSQANNNLTKINPTTMGSSPHSKFKADKWMMPARSLVQLTPKDFNDSRATTWSSNDTTPESTNSTRASTWDEDVADATPLSSSPSYELQQAGDPDDMDGWQTVAVPRRRRTANKEPETSYGKTNPAELGLADSSKRAPSELAGNAMRADRSSSGRYGKSSGSVMESTVSQLSESDNRLRNNKQPAQRKASSTYYRTGDQYVHDPSAERAANGGAEKAGDYWGSTKTVSQLNSINTRKTTGRKADMEHSRSRPSRDPVQNSGTKVHHPVRPEIPTGNEIPLSDLMVARERHTHRRHPSKTKPNISAADEHGEVQSVQSNFTPDRFSLLHVGPSFEDELSMMSLHPAGDTSLTRRTTSMDDLRAEYLSTDGGQGGAVEAPF